MRTRFTTFERQMAYVLIRMRPVIKRKVDAGICIHDILSKEEFERLLKSIDSILAEMGETDALSDPSDPPIPVCVLDGMTFDEAFGEVSQMHHKED